MVKARIIVAVATAVLAAGDALSPVDAVWCVAADHAAVETVGAPCCDHAAPGHGTDVATCPSCHDVSLVSPPLAVSAAALPSPLAGPACAAADDRRPAARLRVPPAAAHLRTTRLLI